jgi:hypothetical protein
VCRLRDEDDGKKSLVLVKMKKIYEQINTNCNKLNVNKGAAVKVTVSANLFIRGDLSMNGLYLCFPINI